MTPKHLIGRTPRSMRRPSTKDGKASLRNRRTRIRPLSPIEIWLATKLAGDSRSDSTFPSAPDQVECSVHVQRIPDPEPDGFFWELDTFVLHLTVVGAPPGFVEDVMESTSSVELERYTGDPESRDAPSWIRLAADNARVFRDSAAAVTNLMLRMGLCKTQSNTQAVIERLAAVRLDG
ncbi:hypothetical protein BV20DRAFT_964465 [Pilatotrama ljubarskyi]|nr:hypothetical protein BV20DRAFT_964465 [Pilatotrama ljubarskyi]